ncbi:MAG: hypothetical protein IPJ00_17585 [Saprospirales bacterium]|nr:hypothetical protein [Saprospirales bacterium]
MFQDDSDFKKSKRALLASATIGLFLGLLGLEFKELNFAIVKFQVNNPTFLFHFIFLVLLYQFMIFYYRARLHYANLQINRNEAALASYRAGKSPDEYRKEKEGYEKNVTEFKAEIDKILVEGNIMPKEDYVWDRLEDIESDAHVSEDLAKRLLNKSEGLKNLKDRISLVTKILADQRNSDKFYKREKILDFYVPLIFGGLGVIAVQVPNIHCGSQND